MCGLSTVVAEIEVRGLWPHTPMCGLSAVVAEIDGLGSESAASVGIRNHAFRLTPLRGDLVEAGLSELLGRHHDLEPAVGVEFHEERLRDRSHSRWQGSVNGGDEPVWSHDGRELFYREGYRQMAVSVTTQSGFRPMVPVALTPLASLATLSLGRG